MDIRLCVNPKIEREYQQAVVRDNNRHVSGDKSDYMVVDIEYAQSVPGEKADYKYDMVGFRWPVAGGSRGSNMVTPVIMEMKAGDGSLASPADRTSGKKAPGLHKHVEDIERFLGASARYEQMCKELKEIYATKYRLELPVIPKRMKEYKHATVEIDASKRPEVLFVLANHQPKSSVLRKELQKLPARRHAEYKIARVRYLGYALFADNMLRIEEAVEEFPH